MFIFQKQITQAIADDHVTTRCGGVVSDQSKPLGQYTKLVRAPDMHLGINGLMGNPLPNPRFLGVFHSETGIDADAPWSRHWAVLSLCFAAFVISGSTALAFWYL